MLKELCMKVVFQALDGDSNDTIRIEVCGGALKPV